MKYANTPCKSIYAENIKNSINQIKKQREKWEPNYIEKIYTEYSIVSSIRLYKRRRPNIP